MELAWFKLQERKIEDRLRDMGNWQIDFLIKWKDDRFMDKNKWIFEGIVLDMKEKDAE